MSIRHAQYVRIGQRVYEGPCLMQTMFAPCEVDEMHLQWPADGVGFWRLRLVRRLVEPKELILACLVAAGLSSVGLMAEDRTARYPRNHFLWYLDAVTPGSGSMQGDLVHASDAVCSAASPTLEANAVVIDVRPHDRRVRVEPL